MYIYVHTYLSIYPSIYLSVYLFIFLSLSLSINVYINICKYPTDPSGASELRRGLASHKSLCKSTVAAQQSSATICLAVFKYVLVTCLIATRTARDGGLALAYRSILDSMALQSGKQASNKTVLPHGGSLI